MIRFFKIAFFLGIALSFMACGEAYRGQRQTNSIIEDDVDFFNRDGERISQTEPHVDQQIFSRYASEMIGDEEDIEVLHDSIEAFDVVFGPGDGGLIDIDARLVLGCSDTKLFRASSFSSRFQASVETGPIDMGVSDGYRLELQCTISDCSEMVAAIHKLSGGNEAILLVPLGVVNSGGDRVLFGVRDLDLLPYFAEFNFNHVSEFEEDRNCRVSMGTEDSIEQSVLDDISDIFGGLTETRNTVTEAVEALGETFGFLRSL